MEIREREKERKREREVKGGKDSMETSVAEGTKKTKNSVH